LAPRIAAEQMIFDIEKTPLLYFYS